MPIFEYVCKECDHQFEALVYGSNKAECPKCQSKKLAQQLRFLQCQRRPLPVHRHQWALAEVAATRAGRARARCPMWIKRGT